MKIQFLIFTVSCLIYVGFSNTVLALSPNVINQKVDLERLTKLLSDDPEEFYKEASRIKNQPIQDKEIAVDFYFLLNLYYYDRGGFDSMVWSLHQAKSFIHLSSSEKLTSVYLHFGTAFYFIGNYDSLNFYQNKVSQLIEEKSPLYAQYLLVEGLKYQLSANYPESIASITEAAKILESQKDQATLAIAYNNLAANYVKINMLDLQLEYLLKALDINKVLQRPYQLALNYNNLGIYFKERDDLETAALYYELAYENLIKLNSAFLLAQNLTNRANIYEKQQEYDRAEKLFLECERICDENQILYGKMLSALNLGNLYRIKEEFATSEIKLKQALDLAKTLKTRREEALTLERLFWLARDKQDFATALDFQSRYHALNDSIINEKVKREVNELRELYEVEKKENAILELSNEKLWHQFIIVAMLVAVLVLLFLVQWFISRHRIATKSKELALKEKEKIELQRIHLNQIVDSKDKELTAQAVQLVEMQKIIADAKNKVKEILKGNSKDETQLKKVSLALNNKRVNQVKYDFDIRITDSNKDFFNILLTNYPDLKPAELKLCAYLRLNLSTKEIAEITNKSVRTVENTRQSIRKKLNLASSDNLTSHLIAVDVQSELNAN